MNKCREEFESSLERTDGFHEGYVTWNEASGMYMANDDDYECMADWMNGAFAIHRKMQAKVEELKATIKGNHGRIAELERLNRVKAQAIIDLHQEITELKASHHGEVIGHEVHLKKIKQERDELQKRIDTALNIIKGYGNLKPSEKFDIDKEIDIIYGVDDALRGVELEQALKGEG
ncbi:hypothetical protein OHW97_01895 [Acinetobacter baumannii]|nr:hypothetical protein [Acinetobacter baumannii]